MFHPIFVHNNKYFTPKIWEMINIAKADVNRLFFKKKKKKKKIHNFCFTDPIIFFYFSTKKISIDVRFHVLNHFPKFQQKIFII